MSHQEILGKIAEVLNLRKPTIKIPNWLQYAPCKIGDFCGRFWPEKFTELNTLVSRISSVEQFLDSSKAHKELDLPATPIEEAIKKSYDWFKEHNRI